MKSFSIHPHPDPLPSRERVIDSVLWGSLWNWLKRRWKGFDSDTDFVSDPDPDPDFDVKIGRSFSGLRTRTRTRSRTRLYSDCFVYSLGGSRTSTSTVPAGLSTSTQIAALPWGRGINISVSEFLFGTVKEVEMLFFCLHVLHALSFAA